MSANRRDAVAALVFAILAIGSTARAAEPVESLRFRINAALEAAGGGSPFRDGILPQAATAVIAAPPPLPLQRWPLVLVLADPPPPPLPPPALPAPMPPAKRTAPAGRRKLK